MAEAFDPDKYLKEKSAPPAFDPDAYLKEKSLAAQPQQPPPGMIRQGITSFMKNHPDFASAADKVGRVLDWPGGMMRTGLASTAGLLTGNTDVARDGDVMNALKGHAPSSAEYLERLGTSPGSTVLDNSITGKVTGRDLEGFALDVATDPLTLLSKGLKGAPYAGKLANPAATALEGAGTSAYKSGLKNLDMATARAGKEPVSDLLLKNRITGDSQQVFDQMKGLGQGLLQDRNAILKNATRAGAEVDMGRATAEAQKYVDELKKIDNPEARKAVGMLQARVNDYTAAAAKEPEQILRELPYTDPATETKFQQLPEALAYEAPNESTGRLMQNEIINRVDAKGKPIVNSKPLKKVPGEPILEPTIQDPKEPRFNQAADEIVGLPVGGQYSSETKMIPKLATVLDESERVSGPTPIQTSAWKTSAANRVGEAGYDQLAKSTQGKVFDKALSSGLRGATEESVGKVLGPEAQKGLIEKNANLGQILSSDEKAYNELEKEARKNGFTSVDGMLLMHPWMLATKKAADVSKGTWARTKGGLAAIDAGKSGVPDTLLRQGLINAIIEQKKRGLLDEKGQEFRLSQ